MQKLYINCNSKRILAEEAFKIVPKEDEVMDEVILYTSNCVNKGKNGICQHCYGVVCESKKEIFDPKVDEFKIETTILRDKQVKDRFGRVRDLKKATSYMDKALKIFSLEQKEYNPTQVKTTQPWEAADRPDSWRTDCLKCRKKYYEQGLTTPCENATKAHNDAGIDTRLASSQTIANFKYPEEIEDLCICTEQRQKIVLVY